MDARTLIATARRIIVGETEQEQGTEQAEQEQTPADPETTEQKHEPTAAEEYDSNTIGQ